MVTVLDSMALIVRSLLRGGKGKMVPLLPASRSFEGTEGAQEPAERGTHTNSVWLVPSKIRKTDVWQAFLAQPPPRLHPLSLTRVEMGSTSSSPVIVKLNLP